MRIGPHRSGSAILAAAGILLLGLPTNAEAQSLEAARTAFVQGIVYAFSRPENLTAVVALGIGFALINRRTRQWAFVLLAAGFGIGLVLARVDWIDVDNLLLGIMFLVPGPMFVASSLPLLAFEWRPAEAMAVSAPVIGALFGIATELEGTSGDDTTLLAVSALTAAVGAGLVIGIVWWQFARPWLATPTRIVGSWILAAGIMLTALGVQAFHTADPKDYFETPEQEVTPHAN